MERAEVAALLVGPAEGSWGAWGAMARARVLAVRDFAATRGMQRTARARFNVARAAAFLGDRPTLVSHGTGLGCSLSP